MLTFYLSLGSKPAWNDLLLAEACGQFELLAPAESALADALLERPAYFRHWTSNVGAAESVHRLGRLH